MSPKQFWLKSWPFGARLEPRWNHILLRQLQISKRLPRRRGPSCPHLRRRRCLFFHREDEIASASLVGQDQLPAFSMIVKFQSLVSSMQGLVGAIECATQRAVLARTQTTGDWVPLDILVPPVVEDIAEVLQDIPQELVRARVVEQSVHIPLPSIKEGIAEVVQGIPPDRVRARIAAPPIMAAPLVLARDEPAENL